VWDVSMLPQRTLFTGRSDSLCADKIRLLTDYHCRQMRNILTNEQGENKDQQFEVIDILGNSEVSRKLFVPYRNFVDL
jgi:hypothetical protein